MRYRLILPIAALLLASCGKKQEMVLETYTAEPTSMSEVVTATGTMESVTQVDVGTQVTGIIDKLYADYNDHVTKGQLLAELEKTLLDSELKSADANMASAKASYEYAKKNYERDKALHDEQLISDYEFQTSKKDYDVARLTYEKSQADRVRAAKNLNYAEIYSPIDGIVISREVEVGQTVVSSMNVANLYVIADLDNMQVVGNVDEADIGQVKLGQAVTFTVDAYPEMVFNGTVTQVRLNPTTESNVVTYEVIVAAPNPEHKLIPGLTANLTIYVTQEKDILTIPNKAFRFLPHDYPDAKNLPAAPADVEPFMAAAPDMKRVWVVRDNALVPVTIKTGVSNGAVTQVISGIGENDVVAVEYDMGMPQMGMPQGMGDGERSPFAPQPPGQRKK